jgi:hypothetical protein
MGDGLVGPQSQRDDTRLVTLAGRCALVLVEVGGNSYPHSATAVQSCCFRSSLPAKRDYNPSRKYIVFTARIGIDGKNFVNEFTVRSSVIKPCEDQCK